MKYPTVIAEYDTIKSVIGGKSLARFGDGELKIFYGAGYVREKPNRKMTEEIRQVLTRPHPNCLVGIPTMDQEGPKYDNWLRHKRRFSNVLSDSVQYYSAFVSRPDSAPWIQVPAYAKLMQQIWENKTVTIICEHGNSLLKLLELSPCVIQHISCPHEGAYGVIDDLEDKVIRSEPHVTIMSVGPTATCLANRLAGRGMHAVDLGSAGGFLLKLLTKKNKPC